MLHLRSFVLSILVPCTLIMTIVVFRVQHWSVYVDINELFILVPALLGLKGNLEMTLASRLSTAVSLDVSPDVHGRRVS